MTKINTKMYSTEVINESNVEYTLKEGNAGVYSVLSPLAPNGGTYTIKCNPNATYREYWVGKDQAEVETIISSDDCIEFESIKIKNGPKSTDSETPSKAQIEKRPRNLYETEVINNTSTDFRVERQGGDGGAAKLDPATLAPKGRHTIRYDPTIGNATYLVKTGAATPITISSRDLVKNERIEITQHGSPGKAILKRVPRENGNTSLWSSIKRALWPF